MVLAALCRGQQRDFGWPVLVESIRKTCNEIR